MAYQILAKDGRPIMKDGDPVKGMDYTIEKIEQMDDKMKSFVAVASTEDEDRDKDIVRQEGWDLKNFKKNPMVPWSHNYWEPPVARSLRTWVDHDSKKLLFKPQFDENDETSMKIFNKYKNGFLKSFSVGFRGLEFQWRDEEDKWGGGIEFTKQELLEVSAVTIPANPNATVSIHGDIELQNMLQLGYPVKFAETEHGLFYPVREELGEFINPEIKTVEAEGIEGLQAVYANSISSMSEDGSFTGDPIAVGYYFDPNVWETPDVKAWINDNTEKTYKMHYYDWKWIDKKKDFKVEEKEVEKEVPHFDEPIKVLTTEDVPDGDDDETQLPDNDEPLTIEQGIAQLTASLEKHLDAIEQGVTKALEKFIEGLSEIKLLINEKTVASEEEIDNNDDDIDLDTPDGDDDSSKSDDEIELDDSLLTPDDKEKTNSDDVIELDDDLLSDKETVSTVVKAGLNEKLKETLKEVRESFKIEV